MSALPAKADIDRGDWHVRLVPEPVVSRCSKRTRGNAQLFDQLIGALFLSKNIAMRF
jgi:hypothetical protein